MFRGVTNISPRDPSLRYATFKDDKATLTIILFGYRFRRLLTVPSAGH